MRGDSALGSSLDLNPGYDDCIPCVYFRKFSLEASKEGAEEETWEFLTLLLDPVYTVSKHLHIIFSWRLTVYLSILNALRSSVAKKYALVFKFLRSSILISPWAVFHGAQ